MNSHNYMNYKDLYKTAVDLINKKKNDNPDFNLQEQTSYCVLATVKENIYIGTNGSNIENGQLIRTCSEYEAVNAMMRKGENKISAMVSVDTKTLKPVLPCEKCRNLIIQINDENVNMNVMREDGTFTTLGELMEAQPIKIDEIGESLNIPKKAYIRPAYAQQFSVPAEQTVNNIHPVSQPAEEKKETVQVSTSDSDDMWGGWDSGSSQVDNGFGKWEAPKIDEKPAPQQPQYNSVYGNNPMPQNPVNPQPQYGSVYGNPVPQTPVNSQPQYGSVYGNQQYGSVYGNPMPQSPVAQQPQYGSVYGNPIPQTPVNSQSYSSVYGTPTSQSIYGSLHGNSGSIPIPGRTSEDEEESLFKQRLSNIMGDVASTKSPATAVAEKEEKLSKEELKQLAKEKKKRAKTNAKFLKSAKKKGLME